MVYFISGHRDITEEEFKKYYVPQLEDILQFGESCIQFVVGDYEGVDIIAQKWLLEHLDNKSIVTVYHMYDKPRNYASKKFKTKGGYKNDIERDSAMTEISNVDIAWIRKGKERSGTAQNILRRKTMR